MEPTCKAAKAIAKLSAQEFQTVSVTVSVNYLRLSFAAAFVTLFFWVDNWFIADTQ